MDVLAFISDQTIYLLSLALPDANPKQIRLLLLSSVGLAIVLLMFSIMWSMFRETPAQQQLETPKAAKPTKAKKTAKAKKAGKTAKPEKSAAKTAKTVPKKAASKKAATKKKIVTKATPTDDIPVEDAADLQAGSPDASAGGFSFFKRESAGAKVDAELISIEQEMLAIRQLYMDERITKDVYIVETRRLYEKATELQSG